MCLPQRLCERAVGGDFASQKKRATVVSDVCLPPSFHAWTISKLSTKQRCNTE